MGWIGVDLDGTLAYYDGWHGESHIGPPIPLMLERVKAWRAKGVEVRIFTARVSATGGESERDVAEIRGFIEKWCFLHLGEVLPVTCIKDFGMVELWDDRAVQVMKNTGIVVAMRVLDALDTLKS